MKIKHKLFLLFAILAAVSLGCEALVTRTGASGSSQAGTWQPTRPPAATRASQPTAAPRPNGPAPTAVPAGPIAPPTAAVPATAAAPSSKLTNFKNGGDAFELSYPENWQVRRNNSTLVLEFCTDKTYIDCFGVQTNDSTQDLDTFSKEAQASLKSTVSNYDELAHEDGVELDGIPVVYIEHTYTFKGENRQGFVIYAVNSGKGFQISATTRQMNYTDLEETFAKILGSFKFIKHQSRKAPCRVRNALYEPKRLSYATTIGAKPTACYRSLPREQGKLRAVAEGARRLRSRKAGHLEPFTRVKLLLAQGRDIWIVTQADTVDAYLPLRDDLLRTGYAAYVVELLDRFTYEEGANLLLYNLLVDTLEHICAEADAFAVVRFYELRLLDLMGFRPELTHCVQCRDETQAQDQFFSPLQGGVVCPRCGVDNPSARPASMPALKFLRHYQRSSFAAARRAQFPPTILREVEALLQLYIMHTLERRLNSPAFIQRVRSKN